MRIVLVGRMAALGRERLVALLNGRHEISVVLDPRAAPAETFEMADVIIGWPLSAEVIARARRLKLLQAAGAGVDGVPFDALGPGVVVANTFHHEVAMAEYVLMAMLYLARRPDQYDARLRQGDWWGSCIWGEEPVLPMLHGSSVLLIGLGHIAREVEQRATAFGMHVHGFGRADQGRWRDQLGEFDFVVPTCPLTSATVGLIGAAEFACMKPSAILINITRGKVVDEQALYEALRDHRIGGAAIDVWYQYPSHPEERRLPSRFPFHELPNVLMSPHNSGWTRRTVERRLVDIAANIECLADGRPLRNVVWPRPSE